MKQSLEQTRTNITSGLAKYYEILFASFLFSGVIQKSLIYVGFDIGSWISFCTGAGLLIVSIILRSELINRAKANRTSLVLIIGFVILVGVSASTNYSEVVVQVKTFTLLASLVPIISILFYARIRLEKLFCAMFIIAAAGSTLYLTITSFHEYFPIALQQKNDYLIHAKALGMAGLGFVFIKKYDDSTKVNIVIFIITWLWMLAARGSLLMFLVCIAASAFFYLMRHKGFQGSLHSMMRLLVVRSAILLIVFGIVYGLGQLTNSTPIKTIFIRGFGRIGQLNAFIAGDPNKSLDTRMDYWEFVLSYPNSFASFLIGNGYATFGNLYSGYWRYLSPHNFLLELLFELGVLGVIWFILIIAVGHKKAVENGQYVIALLMLYELMLHLKSHSFSEMRVYFFLLGYVLFANVVSTNNMINAAK